MDDPTAEFYHQNIIEKSNHLLKIIGGKVEVDIEFYMVLCQ